MIEKVVDRIDELDQPHLKLVVMHDFMWALIEELASNRAHTHQVRNEDSGCGYMGCVRSMTSPRALSTGPFNPVDQWFVNT